MRLRHQNQAVEAFTRIVPTTRTQIEFTFGDCGGNFRPRKPNALIVSYGCVATMQLRS